MANRQKFAFAKRGAAAMLAVTLVSSMTPVMALAQSGEAGVSSAIEAQAQKTAVDDQMVEGQEYTVNITWSDDYGMGTKYLGTQAQVSYENGSYTVKLTIQDSENYSKIGDLTYNGVAFKQHNGVYTITGVESLKEVLAVSLFVAAMPLTPVVNLAIDYTQLPNNGDVTDPTPGEETDASALESLVASAAEIEQGKKTDAAWNALQDAIDSARSTLADEGATQAAIDVAVVSLQGAIAAFDASGDAVEDGMKVGETYSVPVSFTQADGSESMAGKMIGKDAVVVPQEDGSYQVTLVVDSGSKGGYYFKALTFAGQAAAKTYDQAGNYVFTGTVGSLDDSVEVGFTYYVYGMGLSMTHGANATFDADSASEGEAITPAVGVNKADLNAAIAVARAFTQGQKSDDAWNALQTAIATAELAAGNDLVPQVGVDGTLDKLADAITAFKKSADIEDPAPSENEYGMEVGKTYTASVSYAGTGAWASAGDMLNQMVAKYFGNTVESSLLDDGTYNVVVYFGGSSGFSAAIGDITYDGQAIKQSADKTYTVNVPSLGQAIDLSLHVGGSMNADITYAMTVDTSTLQEKAGEPGGEAPSVDKAALQSVVDQAAAIAQGKKADAAWESFQSTLAAARAVLNDANASQDAVNGAAASLREAMERFNASVDVMFQVGHTYQVPMTLFKQGSLTEKSMAAERFGDTALVRPQSDGTFKVTIAATDEGLGYISWLKYNGTQLSQNGNQFTMSIAAAENDTVIPLEMSVSLMQQLGVGQSQTADLHLYLSQAKDLGVNQGNLSASSSNLAQTGDPVAGVAALAIGVGVAGAAAAVAARRRFSLRK